MSLAAEIKGKLSTEAERIFRLSPLGHWLDFTHNSRSDPMLIVLFLQHQVPVTNPDPETLYFDIGPHHRRFGREEFMLLTGLPFGIPVEGSPRDGKAFIRRLFPRLVENVPRELPLRLKVKDLIDLYKDMRRLDDMDVVRVCSLLMVELVFLGRQKHQFVDDALLNIIGDMDAWNEYPFGSYIWSMTYKQMDSAIDRRVHTPRKMTLYGFIHAFEVI